MNSDAAVRAALKGSWLHPRDGRVVLDEVGLFRGQSRVDLVVISDQLEAYEIKSDADSLSRLPAQVEAYSRVFERVTLVCASRHLVRAMMIVPDWWAILEVGRGDETMFERRREGRENPEIDTLAVAQLLWRDDALDVLDRYDCAMGLWTVTRAKIWDALSQHVPADDLLSEARSFFRRRAALKPALSSA